jgi:imidazoleglycerol-phosphate dehydratase
MPERTATVERKTSETQITCTLSLDNEPGVKAQVIEVHTGIGFLDHVREPSVLLLTA